MDIIEDKYYKGFEGEPEIQFIRIASNGNRFILSIWEGFFDRILQTFEPESSGWTGLALNYHLHEGWYQDSPWSIPNIKDVRNQFEKLKTDNLDFETEDVFNGIKRLLLEAESANEIVQISYL